MENTISNLMAGYLKLRFDEKFNHHSELVFKETIKTAHLLHASGETNLTLK